MARSLCQVVQWTHGATSSFFNVAGSLKAFHSLRTRSRMQVRFSQKQASSPNCFPSFFICASHGRVRTKTEQRPVLQIERCEVCVAGLFRFLLDAERNRKEYERNIIHSALQFIEFQFQFLAPQRFTLDFETNREIRSTATESIIVCMLHTSAA